MALMTAERICLEGTTLCGPRLRTDALAAAARDAAPIAIGIAPAAVAIGVMVSGSPISGLAGWAGAPLIFAGAAHVATVSLLGAGASWLAVLGTVLAINARLAIYSAALSRAFRGQPGWFRWAAPYFLVDQLYAAVDGRMRSGPDAEWVRTYYLAVGAAIWLAWVPMMALGVIAGPVLPPSWPIHFAMPALIVGLAVPAVVSRPRPGLAAATVSVVAFLALSGPAGPAAVLPAAVAGMAAGAVAQGGTE